MCENEKKKNREDEHLCDFLLASIADIQGTIRAIDAKLSVLLVLLLVALNNLAGIHRTLSSAAAALPVEECLARLVVCSTIAVFALSWGLSLLFVFKGLIGIHNPQERVKGKRPRGTFYAAGTYKITLLNLLFPFWVKSRLSLQEAITNLPKDQTSLVEELTYEQLKLAFIRDTKMRAQSCAFRCALLWIVAGACLWGFSLAAKDLIQC